jgi:hypothetical protein
MVVWGGDFVNRDESGGRYDPQADSWRATTVFDAPDRRGSHTAVWAGDRMYVWGGRAGNNLGSGGAYLAGADSDGDGVVDGQDCAPDDPGAHSIPAEVTGLLFGGDGETLTWDSAAPDAGEDTVHDVLRGAIGELPVGDAPSETCLAGGVAGTSATDAEVPSPTAGFWYLVRGRNVCEAGTYGYATDGSERISTRCP